MLRPAPSFPPAYLEILDECRLLVGREVRAIHVALDVLAVLVTFSDDPPAACAHSACWSPFGPILDTPIHEDILVALVLL